MAAQPEIDISILSPAEIAWLVTALDLDPGAMSPLLPLDGGKRSKPRSSQLIDEPRWREAFDVLAGPRRLIRIVVPDFTNITTLSLYGDANPTADRFIGFWQDEEGWRISTGWSSGKLLELAERHLRPSEPTTVDDDVAQLSMDGLFALAAAVDVIRFGSYADLLHRRIAETQPFSFEQLVEQFEIGASTTDPRWHVTLLSYLAPPYCIEAAPDMRKGLEELSRLKYLSTGRKKESCTPTERLIALFDNWTFSLPALAIGTVWVDEAGAITHKDYRAVLKGMGPPYVVDFGDLARAEANTVAMHTADTEAALTAIEETIKTPAAMTEPKVLEPAKRQETRPKKTQQTSPPARSQEASKPPRKKPTRKKKSQAGKPDTKVDAAPPPPPADDRMPPEQENALKLFFVGYKRIVLDPSAAAARQSLDDFERAITIAPAMAEPYFGKALALTYVDDLSGALETLDLALKLGLGESGDPALKFEMDDPEDPENMLEIEVGLGFALSLRSDILYGLERPEEALDQIEQVLNHTIAEEYAADFHALKALILVELDRIDEAKAACDEAMAFDTDDVVRLAEARGRIHLAEDNPEAAIEDFSKLVEIDPVDPDFCQLRAAAFANAGRLNEALADYQTALELLQESDAPLSRIKEVRELMRTL